MKIMDYDDDEGQHLNLNTLKNQKKKIITCDS